MKPKSKKSKKGGERDYVAILRIYDIPNFKGKDMDRVLRWSNNMVRQISRNRPKDYAKVYTLKLMK